MNLKKFLVITSLCITLSLFSSNSANAIFGLGNCDRVAKKITKEEEIGKESWNYFRQQVQLYKDDISKNRFLTQTILEVYYSDRTVWTLANNNAKCFNAKQNAEIRRQLSYTNQRIREYRNFMKSNDSIGFRYPWLTYYSSYESALKILQSVKSK